MIRTSVIPKNKHLQIDIPSDYVGKKIEVLLYAEDEIEISSAKKTAKKKPSDFVGAISKKEAANYIKHLTKSRKEWERTI